MEKRQKERLKDILIDHIYDFCFNEVVKKIEGDDNTLTLDVGMKIEDDPITSFFFNRIKGAKKIKSYHAPRNQTYCKVLHGDKGLNRDLANKLKYLEYKPSPSLYSQIEDTVKFLESRSYISKNHPANGEFKLTDKGLAHYKNGSSFEDKYMAGEYTRSAIAVSMLSAFIAFAALFVGSLAKFESNSARQDSSYIKHILIPDSTSTD